MGWPGRAQRRRHGSPAAGWLGRALCLKLRDGRVVTAPATWQSGSGIAGSCTVPATAGWPSRALRLRLSDVPGGGGQRHGRRGGGAVALRSIVLFSGNSLNSQREGSDVDVSEWGSIQLAQWQA